MRGISSRYCISRAICAAVWCTKMIQFCIKKNDTRASLCKQIPGRRDHRSDISLPLTCVCELSVTPLFIKSGVLWETPDVQWTIMLAGRSPDEAPWNTTGTDQETIVPSSNSVHSFIPGFCVKKPSVPWSRFFLEKLTFLMKQQSVITHWYTEGRKKNTTDPYSAYTYVYYLFKKK